MSIVHQENKKTGITYVYESEPYWDKEKQQSRSRRKCIGKLDPVTGELVESKKHLAECQKRARNIKEERSMCAPFGGK